MLSCSVLGLDWMIGAFNSQLMFHKSSNRVISLMADVMLLLASSLF